MAQNNLKVIITLDYELFFGRDSGTAERCLITPTRLLLDICSKYSIPLTFFVDAGYIIALKRYANKFETINNDLIQITNQLSKLSIQDHSIQLHIHPHWEDAIYNGLKWEFDYSRYTLSSFSKHEVSQIFKKYSSVLFDISGKEVIAYRAGGWCVQPFSHIKKAMIENNISIDCSIYFGGKVNSITHSFDFTDAPKSSSWRFSNDPLVIDKNGTFFELPTSHYHLSPFYYWKYAFIKKLGNKKHKKFGDGVGLSMFSSGYSQLIKALTKKSYSAVFIDGYRSIYLDKAFNRYINQPNNEYFVVMGHPKLFSSFSLKKTEKFIRKYHNQYDFITINNI